MYGQPCMTTLLKSVGQGRRRRVRKGRKLGAGWFDKLVNYGTKAFDIGKKVYNVAQKVAPVARNISSALANSNIGFLAKPASYANIALHHAKKVGIGRRRRRAGMAAMGRRGGMRALGGMLALGRMGGMAAMGRKRKVGRPRNVGRPRRGGVLSGGVLSGGVLSGGFVESKRQRKKGVQHNPWIQHVMKVYHANKNLSYGEAMALARKSYKR